MYAASERQYTTAVKEIQVLRGGSLLTNDGRWSEDIDARVGKANAVLRELGRSFVTKREFQTSQSCHFLIDLCSDPYLWSRIFGDDRTSINTGGSARFWISAKTPHGGTQGPTEVRWRLGQEASLAPPCSNTRSFRSNLLYWRKNLHHCWDFLAPQLLGARGIVAPSFRP